MGAIYILFCIFVFAVLLKSNIEVPSSLNTCLKLAYVAAFAVCIMLYAWVRKKLIRKVESVKLINLYSYSFLGIITFVSRIALIYVSKIDKIVEFVPSFNVGFGSYINYGLGRLLNNFAYANVVINTLFVFVCSILIKKIILNITESDTIATITSMIYIFIPQSLVYFASYTRFEYNLVVVLLAIYMYIKIVDEVKNFTVKNKKYIVYAVILGLLQGLDILLGGTYVFWVLLMLLVTLVANYVDIVRIHIGDNIKSKASYKLKRLIEKIEKINISKLVVTMLISLGVSGVFCLLHAIIFNTNNYEMSITLDRFVQNLIHSRNYYIVLIVFSFVFEIIGFVLNRKVDIKMCMLKYALIIMTCILPFMVPVVYTTTVYDTLLVIATIINVCNICFNREEKIKLLKDKN